MNVGYVANSLASAASVNVQAVLAAYGHSVTTSTQAAFGAATFLGQDAILVGPSTRNSPTFVSHLDAHMAAGVPVLVLATDGLSVGQQARASGVPDSTAAALGLVSIERRSSDDVGGSGASAPTDLEPREDGRDEFPCGLLFGPSDYEDQLMLSTGGASGMHLTEVAEPVDGVTGDVREHAGSAAGTRLYTYSQGFTIACAARAGDDRVGVRSGEAFDARCAWFGVSGSAAFGRDGAGVVEGLLQWLASSDDYPTAGDNGAALAAIDLSPLGTYDGGTVSWAQSTPAGTSVVVEVSDDDGATWSAQANGGAVAVLSGGEDVSDKVLLVRVALATASAAATPELHSLVVSLLGEAPSLQGFLPGGELTGALAPDEAFVGGQVVWVTGENAGLAMEVRSWTSATRTLQLWLPMRLDVQPGDEFIVRPGCQKRLIEDCRDRFDNVVNFRGEPYVPGQDQVTTFPDAQM